MRKALLFLAALVALATSAVPAFALNPQPLPPGVHAYEPPDPCLKYHNQRARARCYALHPKPKFCDGSVHCGKGTVAPYDVHTGQSSGKRQH